jgi:hypothetical protein
MKKQTSKRREFLRVIGGVGVASLSVPNYLIGAKPQCRVKSFRCID